MDRNRIRSFATWARYELKKEIEGYLELLKGEKQDSYNYIDISDNDKKRLEKEIDIKGEKFIIDKTATVWFNRVIALRYMEINNFFGTRNQNFFHKCNELKTIFPTIFNSKEFYIDLLLPRITLDEDNIQKRLNSEIDDNEFSEVEIIGWMYQYFISEEKSRVFDELKVNTKIKKEDIPVATQVFTPKWIVKYLVENTLGRFSESEGLKNKLDYYIKEKEFSKKEKNTFIEDIAIIDPCVGSGHILLYAFEILYELYIERGYDKKVILRKILEKNLYGLDIDEYAVELAVFCLIMKAMCYDNNFIDKIRECPLKINIIAMEEGRDISYSTIKSIAKGDGRLKNQLVYLIDIFNDAKEYGSTIKINEDIDFNALKKSILESERTLKLDEEKDKLLTLVHQGELLKKKYDICITNPPYMGIRGMNEKLATYLNDKFPTSKYDLCTVYMEVCSDLLKKDGVYALINQHSWMFLSSFQQLRENMLHNGTIVNMLHLGSKAFEENVGTIVQNVAFVFTKEIISKHKTKIVDLRKYMTSSEKEESFKNTNALKQVNSLYSLNLKDLECIPRQPFAYWTSKKILSTFEEMKNLEYIAMPRQGMATSDNKRFLRYWYEVDINMIKLDASDKEEALQSNKKWFPYRKGGEFRKWFGNNTFVINWESDGKEVKKYAASLYKSYSRTIKNENFYFKEALTYTFISEDLGVRYSPRGFIFDVAGSSIFIEDEEKQKIILGFLCSKVAKAFLDLMNPTYNIQVGDLKNIPIDNHMFEDETKKRILTLVEENIELSKIDWDSSELSWDFKYNPIFKSPGRTFEEKYIFWEKESENKFIKVKSNEEELNKIFIKAYKLEEEIDFKVKDKNITLKKPSLEENIKSFISYAVGCIFGRYSIDRGGVIFAGGDFDEAWKFTRCVKMCKFTPIEDNAILVSEEKEEGSLANKFEEFLAATMGYENLEENLNFISEGLTIRKNETPRERIRRYFFKEFYKDHLKRYNKRPIYWIFTSGEEEGLKVMSYVHRYNVKDLHFVNKEIPRMRRRYEKGMELLVKREIFKKNYPKEIERLKRKLEEINIYEEAIKEEIDRKLEVDLDKGIKENYNNFQKCNRILEKV